MAEVFGLPVGDLPDGWQVVDLIVVAKCVRPDAHPDDNPYALLTRRTDGMTPWETAGMADWVRGAALQQITPPPTND
jgi:hypothetical protein